MLGRVAAGGAEDPDAAAYLDAAGIVDGTLRSAWNTFVVNMKADGIYSNLQVAYPLIGDTQSKMSYNAINPVSFQITWVASNGTGILPQANGVFGDVTNNGYGRTGFVPSVQTNGSDVAIDTVWLGGSSVNNFLGSGNNIFGSINSAGRLYSIGVSTNLQQALGNTALAGGGIGSGIDFRDTNYFCFGESDGSTLSAIVNDQTPVTTSTNTNRCSIEMYVGARNTNTDGNATQRTDNRCWIQYCAVRTLMTAPERTNYYNHLVTLQTDLGRYFGEFP